MNQESQDGELLLDLQDTYRQANTMQRRVETLLIGELAKHKVCYGCIEIPQCYSSMLSMLWLSGTKCTNKKEK